MTRFPKIRASLLCLGALGAACSSPATSVQPVSSAAGGSVGTQPIVAGASSGVSTAGATAGAGAGAGSPSLGGAGGTLAAGATALAGAGFAGASGAATAGSAGAANGGTPTFSMVYADVILAAGCGTGAYCHASDAGGKLKMLDQDTSYAALVGIPAMGALPQTAGAAGTSSAAGAGGAGAAGHAGAAAGAGAGTAGTAAAGAGATNCVDTGLMRVKPGDPDNSLLVKKLEGTQPCGTSMPPGSMLMPEQLSEVRAWIMAGAMNN